MQKLKLIISFLILTSFVFAQDSPFVFNPSLNSDGSKLAFSYQGDIWVSDVDGNNAVRLTIHEAYEGNPQWSPDDSKIAFSSDRYGNNDIFVIPSTGGTSKRLTYHSTGDALSDWSSSNDLIFTSGREFKQIEWNSEIQAVSSNGGTEKEFSTQSVIWLLKVRTENSLLTLEDTDQHEKLTPVRLIMMFGFSTQKMKLTQK
ncbi:MAG: DPP IV N-terminal domain-containing protein [Melioribacteraceae bacterium]|nr:DPP IV N-terminal domain-containing protein [Melioribacteraceae bacterium]